MNLEDIWLQEDAERRIRRTARHEAGHAAAAWLIRGIREDPPFAYIEMSSLEQQVGGVVEGSTAIYTEWRDSLSAIDRGAVILAGVYAQEYVRPYSPSDWQALLDRLEHGDGDDDYAQAVGLARSIGQEPHAYVQQVLARLQALEPALNELTYRIASFIRPGCRVTSEVLAASRGV